MLYYSRIFREKSEKANYLYGIAFTTVAEGWYYSEIGQNNEAMKYYLEALKPAEESGQLKTLAFVYGEVGGGYAQLNMMDKASDFLLKSIKIYRELNDPEREVGRLSSLAYVYVNSGNDQKAMEIELRVQTCAGDSLIGSLSSLDELFKDKRLAFSIHKLLPHIRIFMDDKTIAMTIRLDQDLRKGWAESHPETIMYLKQEILRLKEEAAELLKVI